MDFRRLARNIILTLFQRKQSRRSHSRQEDSFCILPFRQILVTTTGHCMTCSRADLLTNSRGEPYNIHRDRVQDIWNSRALRQLRKALGEGKRPPICAACWRDESNQCQSLRQRENYYWLLRELQSGKGLTVVIAKLWRRLPAWAQVLVLRRTKRAILAAASEQDFRAPAPVSVELEVGRACNLKCRSCSQENSTLIEKDPVQSGWFAPYFQQIPLKQLDHGNTSRESRAAVNNQDWLNTQPAHYRDLFNAPQTLRHVCFKGGEPLLHPTVTRLVNLLNEKGSPEKLRVSLATNGTLFNAPLLESLSRIKDCYFAVSIDGIEERNDYLRYPGRWADIKQHVAKFQRFENLHVCISLTFQAYNLLNTVEVLEYADQHALQVYPCILTFPAFLSVFVMPLAAREAAVAQLQQYLAKPAPATNTETAHLLINTLQAHTDAPQAEQMQDFLRYTRDLDKDRRQQFRQVFPALWRHLAVAGYTWPDATPSVMFPPSPSPADRHLA